MGSSYNAEPMRNSITYQKPTRKIIDVSRRSYDAQRGLGNERVR